MLLLSWVGLKNNGAKGDKINISRWNLPEEVVWIQKLHYFMRSRMHYFAFEKWNGFIYFFYIIITYLLDFYIVLPLPSSALDLGRKLINYFDLFPKYSVPHSGLKTNILEYFPNGLTSTLYTLVRVLLFFEVLNVG